MLACSKQSALLSLKSISRVIQWMDQARAHTTRIAQRLSPRDSTDTDTRHKNNYKNNTGIKLMYSTEIKLMYSTLALGAS